MNYEKEFEDLNQGNETWKPELGVHKVQILTEPEETQFIDQETGVVTYQIKLAVKTQKGDFNWYVGKGKTTQSLYGQLMVIGKSKGKLKDETITLTVNETSNNGKKRKQYTVMEAIELMQQMKDLKPTTENIE